MNFDHVIKTLITSPAAAGLAGTIAGGLLARGGRKLGKNVLELGGMAALAGLAYTAWQRHRSQHAAVEPPSQAQLRDAGFLPSVSHPTSGGDLDTALFRAMVAAARCDGRLDIAERRVLLEQIEKLGLPEGERAELYAQLEKPASLDEIVASATTPQRALEIYAASRVAIEPDSPAERGYLALLAARLGLEDGLVAEMERNVAAGSARSTAVVSVTR